MIEYKLTHVQGLYFEIVDDGGKNREYDVVFIDKLTKFFESNPNSTIVFSCFISDERKLINHFPHIWERFYGESYITLNDLETYCNKNNLKLIKHMDFIAMGGYNHQIFKWV
jgi:hypothetical protein